ncbi:hypothetical protein GmHk_20G057326 [Glycine max]|nr:hypothetical protein GmHk_20G057326 [Glycine max]
MLKRGGGIPLLVRDRNLRKHRTDSKAKQGSNRFQKTSTQPTNFMATPTKPTKSMAMLGVTPNQPTRSMKIFGVTLTQPTESMAAPSVTHIEPIDQSMEIPCVTHIQPIELMEMPGLIPIQPTSSMTMPGVTPTQQTLTIEMPSETPPSLEFMKQRLEMMASTMETSGHTLSPQMRAQLDSGIKNLLRRRKQQLTWASMLLLVEATSSPGRAKLA